MPPRSDVTRDNNPEWRGGNPYYEYIQQLISAHEEKKKNIVDEGGDDDAVPS